MLPHIITIIIVILVNLSHGNLSNMFRVIKYCKLIWVGHVAIMEDGSLVDRCGSLGSCKPQI